MSEEKVQAEADSPKNLIVLATVLISVFSLIVILVGIREYFEFSIRDEIGVQQLQPVDARRTELTAHETKALSSYQWVDKEKGVVRIPVEQAMELTIRDWNNRPTPAPAAAPTNGATPTNGAAPTTPAPTNGAAPTTPAPTNGAAPTTVAPTAAPATPMGGNAK